MPQYVSLGGTVLGAWRHLALRVGMAINREVDWQHVLVTVVRATFAVEDL
jgi:hypothetical protein